MLRCGLANVAASEVIDRAREKQSAQRKLSRQWLRSGIVHPPTTESLLQLVERREDGASDLVTAVQQPVGEG